MSDREVRAARVFDEVYSTSEHGDKQRDEFKSHWVSAAVKGVCPYSGESITFCQSSDLCDCFAFPKGNAL